MTDFVTVRIPREDWAAIEAWRDAPKDGKCQESGYAIHLCDALADTRAYVAFQWLDTKSMTALIRAELVDTAVPDFVEWWRKLADIKDVEVTGTVACDAAKECLEWLATAPLAMFATEDKTIEWERAIANLVLHAEFMSGRIKQHGERANSATLTAAAKAVRKVMGWSEDENMLPVAHGSNTLPEQRLEVEA